MKIVIYTQHCENYAAHNWNGDGECPQGWKYKGGTTYILQNVKVKEVCDRKTLDTLVNDLIDMIVYANNFSQEYVINWELLDDKTLTNLEPWEAPIYISRRDGEFKATITMYNDGGMDREVNKVVSHYTMRPAGERANFNKEIVYNVAA